MKYEFNNERFASQSQLKPRYKEIEGKGLATNIDLLSTEQLAGLNIKPINYVAADPAPQLGIWEITLSESRDGDGVLTITENWQAVSPTTDDVNAERDRRKDLPVTVTVGGETFPVDCHPAGREAIDAMATAVAIGLIDPVSFRDANNVDHDLTPLEIKSMALQVMAALEALHQRARELKAMDPIPLNFADEKYWIEDPA